jgi:polysaccharide export outer membrane protein
MRFKFSFFLILLVQLSLTCCVSKKKINYFQNIPQSDSTNIISNISYTPIFKSDDFLSIVVTASNEEAIKPFVLEVPSGGSQVPNYNNGIAARAGYLIDENGDIDFPILGKIHLGGLNRSQATELIKNQLSEYITNPVINIRIQNFKVTVLGDVKSPGSFNIPNERITLPEIIGIAGDLNITGLRNNILVIRDINGVKTEYRVDLTSKEVFQSPVYYLSQNDVVYVEPNRAKRNSSLISSTAGVFISVTSLVLTTINLLTK